MRTFNHPVIIRVEEGQNIIKVCTKVSDGMGGYKLGNIILDTCLIEAAQKLSQLKEIVAKENFWHLDEGNLFGNDGSEWLIEICENGKYHLVRRWSPGTETGLGAIGKELIDLAPIPKEKSDIY